MSDNIASMNTSAPDPNYLTLNLIQKDYNGKDVKFAQEMLLLFMPDYAADVVPDGVFGAITENGHETLPTGKRPWC